MNCPTTPGSAWNTQEFQDCWREVQEDPSLQSTLDIDALLRETTDRITGYIEDYREQTRCQLSRLSSLSEEVVDDYCRRLANYHFVDEVHQFLCGRYLRWIRREPKYNSETDTSEPIHLYRGGILNSLQFSDKGVVVTIVIPGRRYVHRLAFDDYLFFHKISDEEMFLLEARRQMDEDG